jgi:oligopeptide/dipeptide ABC transporter ATP-binding protein
VMYLGKIVEVGDPESIMKEPLHPYTQMLVSSIPSSSSSSSSSSASYSHKDEKRMKPRGEAPSAINPPNGCRFNTRCPFVRQTCRVREPDLLSYTQGRSVACHMVNGDRRYFDDDDDDEPAEERGRESLIGKSRVFG